MKTNILVLIVLDCFICLSHSGKVQYGSGGTQYVIRILNFSQCPSEIVKKPFLVNLITNQYGLNQYVSCTAIVEKPLYVKRIMTQLERCRDYQYACENFQTWNMTGFCKIAIMKNQVWSQAADAVSPSTWKRTCPMIEKGNYTVTNATANVNQFIQMYSEAAKYHWRIKVRVFDRANREQYCVYTTLYIVSFNKRSKS